MTVFFNNTQTEKGLAMNACRLANNLKQRFLDRARKNGRIEHEALEREGRKGDASQNASRDPPSPAAQTSE